MPTNRETARDPQPPPNADSLVGSAMTYAERDRMTPGGGKEVRTSGQVGSCIVRGDIGEGLYGRIG